MPRDTPNQYYTPYAIHDILHANAPRFVKKDGNYIMNEAISFDIEVTSMYYNNEKIAFMYVWMIDIFDRTVIGRTWEDFVYTMNTISSYFQLNGIKRRLICYVHNLAYEFQFIRKWFKWIKVFSLSRRKPLYALTTTGIEFRCSYRLTGYKLEKVGEQMGIEKLGDFDYSKIRHNKTTLTKREIQYCIHDVKIVTALIRQKMKEENDNISEIPLTKTGYVRRYVRNHTLRGNNRCFYKNAIQAMTLEPDEYEMAKKAFAGGFTHASFLHARHIMKNVASFDFGSSYPTVLISEMYPMTKGRLISEMTLEQFEEMMDSDCCCIFKITLEKVSQIFPTESYISFSRCDKIVNPVVNNGRVVSADSLTICMTSIDYNIIRKVYKFTPVEIGHFYLYGKQYLPTTFVECILHFYNIKTKLKEVDGKESEYMNGKENLNAIYGMCVTDIVRELVGYNDKDGWEDSKTAKMTDDEYQEYLSNQLDKENKKKSRFLFYLWGVFCTAYARRNLWTGIFECKSDYIYSDTDSVKITNYEKHKEYFENYNKEIISKLERALDYHHLPHELICPENIKGEKKYLGIWDYEGTYHEFKAIRAKSYLYLSTDKKGNTDYHMTVAGLSKKDAIAYLKSKGNPMRLFRYGMKIPKENTGKLTHTYIDEPFTAYITDYKGVANVVHERSCIHLEPASFHLSKAALLTDILNGKKPNVYE